MGADESGVPRTKHYLVSNLDTSGTKRTLPDFLLDCPQFQFMLQLTTAPDGSLQFLKTAKLNVLGPYVNRSLLAPPPKGYEPLGSGGGAQVQTPQQATPM